MIMKRLLQFPLKKVKMEVPNVVGMNVAKAINVLQRAGIAYEFCGFKEIVPPNVMEGTVSIQSPLGGSPVKKNMIVKLYISMDLKK